MTSPFDLWKTRSPYEVKPYTVVCRDCREYLEPDDAASEFPNSFEDGLVEGLCKPCAKAREDAES